MAVDIQIVVNKDGIKMLVIEMWFGSYQSKAAVKSVASVIQNMIDGVIKGHKYKMKSVYAHFPITLNVLDSGKALEIRNYVGKILRLFCRRKTSKEAPNARRLHRDQK